MDVTCSVSWSNKEVWGLLMNKIHVRVADWQKDNADIRRIRDAVFVFEQSVPPELEWDSEDAGALHFLALEGDYAVGTARLLPDGEFGRLSVLKDWRGLNVGEALITAILAEAERRNLKQTRLSAQVHATALYERFGFTVVSDEFLEAGLPHVDMVRNAH